jgi:hypothetical protein
MKLFSEEIWFRLCRDQYGRTERAIVHWKGFLVIAIGLISMVTPQFILGFSYRGWGMLGPLLMILLSIRHTEDA